MKDYLSIIIIFFTSSLFSQTISGLITDFETGSTISANMLLKDEQNEVIDFYLVRNNGYYHINLDKISLQSKLVLEVYKYGYITQSQVLEINILKDLVFNFELEKSLIELKPIYVEGKSRAIKIENDTVTYDSEAFKDGSERVVEDLLRKLPGINVLDDGTIQFKGKDVKKVLLEGDDLFDKNYVTGTRNISADIIDKIQAIENFTENPLLRGLEDSQEVALNLKLKKGMVDLSGNGYLGLGIEERYTIGINSIGLNEKHKNFSTISTNNLGKNNSPYDYFSHHPSRDQLENYPRLSSKMISEEIFKSNFKNQRSNNNQTKYGSFNHIYKINAKTVARLNFNYLNDKIIHNKSSESNYFFENQDPISVYTDNSIIKRPTLYNSDLKFSHKPNSKSMWEFENHWFEEEIITDYTIKSNRSQNIDSNKKSKSYFLKNEITYTNRLNDNKALLLKGIYSSNSSPQFLQMSPAIDFLNDEYIYNQEIMQFSSTYKNKVNLTGSLIGVDKNASKYAVLVSGGIETEGLYSFLSQNEDNINYNKLDINTIDTRLASFYKFSFNKFNIKPGLSLISHWTKVKHDLDSSFSKQFISPDMSANYKMTQNTGIFFSTSYRESSQNIRYLYADYILTSFRNLNKNNPNFSYQKNFTSLIGLSHNDLYNQFKFILTINYRNINNKFLNKNYIKKKYSMSEGFLFPHKTGNYSISLNIEKYLPYIKSTVRFDSNNAINEYKNIINNSEIRDNLAYVSFNEFYIRTSFDLPVNFQNTVQVQYFENKVKSMNSIDNASIQNQFKILFNSTNKKIFASTTFEYYNPKIGTSNPYYFLDLEFRYTPNTRWNFAFEAMNITGNKTYQEFSISDYYIMTDIQSLNKPYYLMRLGFKF